MRDIFAENLYDAKKYNRIVTIVVGLEKSLRRDTIFSICEKNPHLAALCLKKFRGGFKRELQASVKQQALLQVEKTVVAGRNVVTLAVLALYELREYVLIGDILVSNPEQKVSHWIIKDIFGDDTKEDHSELVFRFLNILFEHLPKNGLGGSPVHGLWKLALESLPDSLLISEHHVELEKFYRFFASRNSYFSTLHLLPEKIERLFARFKTILGEFDRSFRLREVYLNLAKRNPVRLWYYVDKLKTENISLDTRVYNRLISYTKDFQTANLLFEEMQHLPVDEITYSTLINKANYEQGIKLFEEMKQQNLPANEITYSTLINKANYEQASQLFEEMKQHDIPINEITYNTLISKTDSYEQAIELFNKMKSIGLIPDKFSYHILMKKTKTVEYSFKLFEEMKDNNIQPDVFIFNTLLSKATQSKQPLNVILELLDEMIQLNIKPNVKQYRTKKGKLIKPYTILAVQQKLKKSQKPYKKWVQEKQTQLKHAPLSIYTAWEEFFQQTTKTEENK